MYITVKITNLNCEDLCQVHQEKEKAQVKTLKQGKFLACFRKWKEVIGWAVGCDVWEQGRGEQHMFWKL